MQWVLLLLPWILHLHLLLVGPRWQQGAGLPWVLLWLWVLLLRWVLLLQWVLHLMLLLLLRVGCPRLQHGAGLQALRSAGDRPPPIVGHAHERLIQVPVQLIACGREQGELCWLSAWLIGCACRDAH